MPIRPRTLREYGERYITMDGAQTLRDALQKLNDSGYQENQVYLIVARNDKQFQVSLFSKLKSIVAMLGYDSFLQPLQTLPIPFAERVVPANTPESGQEILEWVTSIPQATLVVVENDQVIGLFANPSRSGDQDILAQISQFELPGEFQEPNEDIIRAFLPKVHVPVCPHCRARGFFRFGHQVYTCRHCDKVVKSL